jgi:hypothetical protein
VPWPFGKVGAHGAYDIDFRGQRGVGRQRRLEPFAVLWCQPPVQMVDDGVVAIHSVASGLLLCRLFVADRPAWFKDDVGRSVFPERDL